MARTRRAFLKQATLATGAVAATALGTAAAAATGTAAHAPAPTPGTPSGSTGAMRHRTLGRTGLSVSEIGFGGYPIDDPQIVPYALDHGINYIDTAHCYRGGRSEEIIGAALKGRRQDVVLTTKWCPHHVGKPATKRVFLASLDDSLR